MVLLGQINSKFVLMDFNIRVYGILVNSSDEVLLSDERRHNKQFTKFPGGGLEYGEGIKECLKREFKEELHIDVEVGELIYLTDFFQQSAFNPDDQIISVYYSVSTKEIDKIPTSEVLFDFKNADEIESFRWRPISEITKEEVTFPIDKKVVGLISKNKNAGSK